MWTWDDERRARCCSLVLVPKSPAVNVTFSPDGKTLAATEMSGLIHQWDVETLLQNVYEGKLKTLNVLLCLKMEAQ